MKVLKNRFFLICGMLLTLAAFPAFGQKQAKLDHKPLANFGRMISQKTAKKKLDLTAPFSLEISGTLGKDGNLNRKTMKITKTAGNKKMIEVAKSAVEALSDTGIFLYLSSLGAKDVTISIDQTKNDFTAVLKSSLETPNRAVMVSSGLSMFFKMGLMEISKRPDSETEQMLLKNMTTVSTGKDFLLKFSMPSKEFHGMINRELEKVK